MIFLRCAALVTSHLALSSVSVSAKSRSRVVNPAATKPRTCPIEEKKRVKTERVRALLCCSRKSRCIPLALP